MFTKDHGPRTSSSLWIPPTTRVCNKDLNRGSMPRGCHWYTRRAAAGSVVHGKTWTVNPRAPVNKGTNLSSFGTFQELVITSTSMKNAIKPLGKDCCNIYYCPGIQHAADDWHALLTARQLHNCNNDIEHFSPSYTQQRPNGLAYRTAVMV